MKRIVLLMIISVFLNHHGLVALLYKISDEDLCRKSAVIIIGKVIGQESWWDNEYRRIYTYVTIEVDEKIKGDDIGKIIKIKIPGGVVGEIGMTVSDITPFSKGEEDFLFLKKIENKNTYELIGKNQGRMIIVTDSETHEKFVRNAFFSYAEVQGKKIGEIKTTKEPVHQEIKKLSDFKREIETILKNMKEES